MVQALLLQIINYAKNVIRRLFGSFSSELKGFLIVSFMNIILLCMDYTKFFFSIFIEITPFQGIQ